MLNSCKLPQAFFYRKIIFILIELSASQVVYLADNSGYIPINPLRSGGPAPIAPQLYAGADLESWRPELWDRDYNRRYRYNNTRVQRKWHSED
jgi:hypothetical protein